MLEVHELPSCQAETAEWKQFVTGSGLISKGDVSVVLLPIEGEVGGQLGEKWQMQLSTTFATVEIKNNDKFIIGTDTYIIVNKPTLFKNNPAFKNFYQFEVKIKNVK